MDKFFKNTFAIFTSVITLFSFISSSHVEAAAGEIYFDDETGSSMRVEILEETSFNNVLYPGDEFTFGFEITNVSSGTFELGELFGMWFLCTRDDILNESDCLSDVDVEIYAITSGVLTGNNFIPGYPNSYGYVLETFPQTLNPSDSFSFYFDGIVKETAGTNTYFVSSFIFFGENFTGTPTDLTVYTDNVEKYINALSPSTIDIYRLYNAGSSSHFYTNSNNERQSVLNSLPGYYDDGKSFQAFSSQIAGSTPVYRFYNANTGSHFYTSSLAEKNSVQANLAGYYYEGITYYVYPNQVTGSKPLYRFYNANSSSHFYTTSPVERDNVRNNLSGYFYEGVAYYVL